MTGSAIYRSAQAINLKIYNRESTK